MTDQSTIDQNYYDALDSMRFWLRCIDFRDGRIDGPAEVLRWAQQATDCLMEAVGFASQRAD